MQKSRYAVIITLEENLLGTTPHSKEVFKNYLKDKIEKRKEELGEPIPTENEEDFIKEAEEKGYTGFPKDENGLFIWDYVIKGFLKNAAKAMQEAAAHAVTDDPNAVTKKVKKDRPGYKIINDFVFIQPRRIYFGLQEPDGILERPLRAMTMQGERVSLTRSDYINKGRTINCEIHVLLNKINEKRLRELLDYGFYLGLGQWRNARWGSFTYELIELT